jgi:cell division protein FtsB
MKKWWDKYKYWIIGLAILSWMTIFDSNNFIDLIQLRSEVSDLKEQKTYYQTEINKALKAEKELFSSQNNLEQFAREKYLMKRDSEDLFIIVETPEEDQ